VDKNVKTSGPTDPTGKISRRERSRATRRRILDAARTELIARGYHATLMSDIADRAGVSVQMLYFSFGTKPSLVAAAVGAAVHGDAGIPPEQTEWFAELTDAPTAAETIRRFIMASGPIFHRASALVLVQREGAATDPDLARTVHQGDAIRASTYRRVVELAANNGSLKVALDISTATDILVAVYSPTLYMEFVNDRRWTETRTLAWLAATVPSLICSDDTAPTPAPVNLD
jgi:AcrR family transcriptional regulator